MILAFINVNLPLTSMTFIFNFKCTNNYAVASKLTTTLFFRYAKALKAAGVEKGDVVCMFLGRNNTDVFYASFGTWILGGALFFGDVRSGPQALASQVKTKTVFNYAHINKYYFLEQKIS